MALTPGGGRSPSTKPPPSTPPPGQQRVPPDQRPRVTPRAASISMVRWGVLIGGLVIIADLATQAIIQRSPTPDDVTAVRAADEILNSVLYLFLGIAVVRDTRLIYAGALAGLLAALLDALVVAAAASMAPTPIPGGGTIEEVFVSNIVIWPLFAAVSGVVYATVQRVSGGRRQR